jgi:hypothetical protein
MLEHIHQKAQEDLRAIRRRKRRYVDPTALHDRVTIYAVYHWHTTRRQWELVTFTKTSLQRWPSQRLMDRVRRKLEKKKRWQKEMKIVQVGAICYRELLLASRHGPPTEPPQHVWKNMKKNIASRETPRRLTTIQACA